jgi:hypothetical protein
MSLQSPERVRWLKILVSLVTDYTYQRVYTKIQRAEDVEN